MNSLIIRWGVVLFLLALTVQSVSSQSQTWNNGIGHGAWEVGLPDDAKKQMLDLWESIGADLKTDPHELTGTYVKGGYEAGYFLRWSVNKGFVLIPYFDQNLITDFGYGIVTVTSDSEITLRPEKELNGGRSLGKIPMEWVAIWHYFIPVEMLGDFFKFQAGLGDYNEFNGQCCEFSPNFLSQRVEGTEKRRSYPVPIKYKHLVRNPIKAEITFVGRRQVVKDWGYHGKFHEQGMEKAVLVPVKINAGRKQGVKRNMLFRMIGEPDFYQYLQIMVVGQALSSGYVVGDISSDGKEHYHDHDTGQGKPLPPIRKGTKVTTSPVPEHDLF